jgi:1-acyl-sn-glycerol-3-phosphate acyltransferase
VAVVEDRSSRARTQRARSSVVYRITVTVLRPAVSWWGRLEVSGADLLPRTGPALLVVNHDSGWDPPIIGVATAARRQITAMARSTLWKPRPCGWAMDQMRQIPVDRENGSGGRAFAAAVQRLRAGECVGLFPEGMISRGRNLPLRSGAGRLALEVPEAVIVCAAITGSPDLTQFPRRRPRLRVEFFSPASGPPRPGETAAELTARLVGEIRAISPPVG